MGGNIIFIGAGGTIASLGRDPYDILDYHSTGNRLAAAEILNRLPPSPLLAGVQPIDFRNLDSTAVTGKDWHDLAGLCERLATDRPSLAGIVIGHGTASLEETAYCLSLTLDLAIPVVVTGAMRPLSGISSDAARNIIAALHVAGSPLSAGRGVLVVLNDEIHTARVVTKTSTSRLDAFRSPDSGPLGEVLGDQVVFHRHNASRDDAVGFRVADIESMPRVDIVYSHASADDTAIRAFVEAGAKGIVSAGFGPGVGTPAEIAGFEWAMSRGVVVVQSSRTGSGRALDTGPQRAMGIVPAGNLNPQKARILLGLALSRTADPAELRRIFETH